MVLPHEVLPHVIGKMKKPVMERAQYWRHMEKYTPWAGLGQEGYLPVFLYGDDARYNKQSKLTVVYMGMVTDEEGSNSMMMYFPLFLVNEATFGVLDQSPYISNFYTRPESARNHCFS